MPAKIMITRHAEKPSDNGGVRGVEVNGSHDPDELSVRGWQRAGALIRFFAPQNGAFAHSFLATPDAIFACHPQGHVKSVRSAHTVQLLAQFLNKTIDLNHERGSEDHLVQAVMATQGVVLIAWEHDAIPDIVSKITGEDDVCPKKWPDSRFDVVWVLDRNPTSAWALTQVPQLVLPGDRAEVIEFVKTGKP